MTDGNEHYGDDGSENYSYNPDDDDFEQSTWDGVSKPDPEEFYNYDQYHQALTSWTVDQKLKPNPSNQLPPLTLYDVLLAKATSPGAEEYENVEEYTLKAQDAAIAGDPGSARLHMQRAESWKRDFDNVGKKLKSDVDTELLRKVERSIEDAQNMTAEQLAHPKLEQDAKQLLNYYNRKSDENRIYIMEPTSNNEWLRLKEEYNRLLDLAREAESSDSQVSIQKAKDFRERAGWIESEMDEMGNRAGFSGKNIVKVELFGGDSSKAIYSQFNGDNSKIREYLMNVGLYNPKGHGLQEEQEWQNAQTGCDSEDGYEIESFEPNIDFE